MPRKFRPGHNNTKHPIALGPRLGRQQSRYYYRLKGLGLCTKCGQEPNDGETQQCRECREKAKKGLKNWYAKNRASKNKKFCAVCGVTVPSNQVLCSEHRFKNCEACGKRFELTKGITRNAKFCSRRCNGDARKGKLPKGFGKSGSEAPNWQGGKTKPWLLKRETPELRKWTKKVYQRDNWTCQDCGARGVTLHAHHIKSFSKYPELRTDLNNGVTLCVPCHSKRHGHKIATLKFYGKGKVGQMKLFDRRIS
jgi:predicted nucleic acid-binding Zn ribbon protein